MDIFRSGSVAVTYNNSIRRFAFIDANAFISATIPTFKIILKLLGMQQHMSILIRQDTSSVDLLCNTQGASLLFLNNKSKMHRSRVVLDAEFIVNFLLHEIPMLAAIDDPSYSTNEGEKHGLKRALEEAEQENNKKPQPTYEMVDTPDTPFYGSGNFDFSTNNNNNYSNDIDVVVEGTQRF